MTDSERLAVIETVVKHLELSLLGDDGQGGKLGAIDEQFKGYDSRLTKLENWRWWVVGIAVGLGIALGGVGKAVADILLRVK